MEKKITNFAFALLALCLTFVSCSKDDASGDEAITIDGGQVAQAQVTTVALPGADLSDNIFDATIGGAPIKVVASGDNTITFYTPTDLAPGNYDVVIPGLNATVTVEVLPTQLTQSADETMSDFLSIINGYSQTLGTTPEAIKVQHSITAFNTFYASASAEQKNAFAVLYKANKTQFDDFFLNPDGNRSIVGDFDVQKFTRNTKAVWQIALGAALVVTAPVLVTGALATVAVGVTGVLIAQAGCENAYSINEELVDEVYETISLKVGSWFGSNDRLSPLAQGISLKDNVVQVLPFDFVERHITSADANSTEPLAVEYFKDFNRYNQIVSQTNTLIGNLQNSPGIDYENVTAEQLPATSPQVNNPVSAEMFTNMTFSVNNPDLSIQQSSIAASGQLSLKIKIAGNPSTLPIQTTLKYSYSDGLSRFTGTLPLTVSPSVIGTWKMVTFDNGKLPGEYVNYSFADSCPSLATAAYTMISDIITIGETTYATASVEKDVQYNLSWSGCTVLSNGADIFQTFNDTDSGTYVMDDTTYTATASDGTVISIQFEWINKNKVKFGDSVYERQ
jgi:hypothetical protein